MTFALHIPTWFLWLIGVPLAVALIALAAFGACALRALFTARWL